MNDLNTVYSWHRIVELIKSHKGELLTANILAIIATLATLPLPALLPLLVDEVLLNTPGKMVALSNAIITEAWQTPVVYIVLATVLTVILRLTGLAFNIMQLTRFTAVAKAITYKIRIELIARISQISLKDYHHSGSGKLTAACTNDVDTLDSFLGSTLSRVIVSVLTLIGVATVLAVLSWQLALFILLFNPIVIYFTLVMGRQVQALKFEENTAIGAFQQGLIDTLDALVEVRLSNQSVRFFDRVKSRASDVRTASQAFGWKSETAQKLSFIIFLLGFDLFRAIGMVMVLLSDLSIGQMIAIFGYLWLMMQPVQELLNIHYSFKAANGALVRINQVLSFDTETQETKTSTFTSQPKSIGFDKAHFSYGEHQPDVLNNLCFEVNAGETLALVGASGGGKSTLINCLLGFYSLSSGHIRIDNKAVTQSQLQSMRSYISAVMQHPVLFNDSIRYNLTYGESINDEAIWTALEICEIADFIRRQDKGLDTFVGRNGMKLSGGQRQRLAIARMILQNPSIVIMDEATSALDLDTERRIYKNLEPFLKNRTTLIVAHRLSSIRQADRVIVIEDGQVQQSGTHDQLIQTQGIYQKFFG